MSKIDKLIERLKSKPKDFSWDEMLKILKYILVMNRFLKEKQVAQEENL